MGQQVVLHTTPPAGMGDDFMLDVIVYIGRFQPLHIVHEEIIRFAARHAKRVVVLIGSAESPRSTRNPFTYGERARMVNMFIHRAGIELGQVYIMPLADQQYNDTRWISTVHDLVGNISGSMTNPRIGIIGGQKDSSSYYLGSFPAWAHVGVDITQQIHATDIRQEYLNGFVGQQGKVSESTGAFLRTFKDTPEYTDLATEQNFIDTYRKSWEVAPYPPTFVCTDAVVIQAGHVLLIKRADNPGRGLWAFPGGFMNQNETLLQCAVRELLEETGLRLTERIIRKSLVSVRCFDDPNRSARGRTLTHAHYFKLDDVDSGLPKVVGGDDAAKAEWVSLDRVRESEMYEDHYAILNVMVGL